MRFDALAGMPFGRHLHIPLVLAERAWAMAMELKAQLEAGHDPAKRHHLIRRLTKVSTPGSLGQASLLCQRDGSHMHDHRTVEPCGEVDAWLCCQNFTD